MRLLDGGFGDAPPRLKLAHVPRILDRVRVQRLQDRWAEDGRRTSARRFRGPTDLSLGSLYAYDLLDSTEFQECAAMRPLDNWSSDYCFVMLADDVAAVHEDLNRVLALRPRFFCINDDLSDTYDPEIDEALSKFLGCYFLTLSSFEKPAGQAPS